MPVSLSDGAKIGSLTLAHLLCRGWAARSGSPLQRWRIRTLAQWKRQRQGSNSGSLSQRQRPAYASVKETRFGSLPNTSVPDTPAPLTRPLYQSYYNDI
jgi:hypothetical protein